MATAKKPAAHKSYASNPPKSKYAAAKKNTATARKTAIAKRNPATLAKKRPFRRNPSPSTNAALLAIGGALVINIFDEGVNRFMPALSNPFRIGVKVVAGYVAGTYGRRFLGSWASVAQNALWLAAALDGFNTWVRPQLSGWLTPAGAPAITGQQQVQNPQTGELGTRYYLQDGNSFDVFEGTGQMAYAN